MDNLKKAGNWKFLGYDIIHTGNSDGHVLKKDDFQWKCHLGNYTKLEDAKRVALFHYMMDNQDQCHGMLRNRMLYRSSIHLEYAVLADIIKADGYEMPEEITPSKDMNQTIMFNGEVFGQPPLRQGEKSNRELELEKKLKECERYLQYQLGRSNTVVAKTAAEILSSIGEVV